MPCKLGFGDFLAEYHTPYAAERLEARVFMALVGELFKVDFAYCQRLFLKWQALCKKRTVFVYQTVTGIYKVLR